MFMLTRTEAGRRLAEELLPVQPEAPVVLALSPGGARVGSEIARQLQCPLDIIAVFRLEVPGRQRSTFGAVADGVEVLLPDRVAALHLPDGYIESLLELGRREVARLSRAWRGDAPVVDLHGRTIILVDDGLGDGIMLAAAATALSRKGAARVLFAAPSASADLMRALRESCERQILLYPPDAPVGAVVCDPAFAHTTGPEIPALVRRSRPNLVAATPG